MTDITVSEDRLDAKLTGLELRLVDRITKALDAKADEAVVSGLEARVRSLESAQQASSFVPTKLEDVEGRTRKLERFRYAVPSATAIATVVSAIALTLAYWH